MPFLLFDGLPRNYIVKPVAVLARIPIDGRHLFDVSMEELAIATKFGFRFEHGKQTGLDSQRIGKQISPSSSG
jgi:hypothetical protein